MGGLNLPVRPGPATRTAALSAFLLVITACGEGGDGEAPHVVRDSSGIRIVENQRDGTNVPTWSISDTPIAVMGEGEADRPLDRVEGAVGLDDGRIAVADAGSSEILIYDSSGSFRRALGGEGQGPGEFQDLSGVTLAGDSLVAFDAEIGRLTVFAPDGLRPSVRDLDATGDPSRPIRMYRLAGRFSDGRLVLVPDQFPGDMRPEPTLYWDSVPNLVYGPDGTLQGQIGRSSRMQTFANERRSLSPPFARRSVAAAGRDRLFLGLADDYEVRVYGADGGLAMIIRRDDPLRPVTERDLDSLIAHRVRQLGEDAPRERARQRMRQLLDRITLPDRKPVYQDLAVDKTGSLWVRGYQPPWASGSARWSVYGPDGRHIAEVDLPHGLRPTWIGEDRILGVHEGPLEVQTVRMYSLSRR